MENIITISGLPGSGSTTTAKLLAEKLSYNYFTIGQVFKDISRSKIKEKFYYKELKDLCDEKGLIIPDFENENDTHGVSNLLDTEFGKSKEFHNVLDELQIKISEKSNTIIDGKLAISMIPNADLRVWLKAPLEERAKRATKRDDLNPEEAQELLRGIQDKFRTEWKNIYGIDFFTQEKKADLVIDTSDLTPEQVVEKILISLKNN